MAGQGVYLCFEERPGRDLLAACPQLGDVEVSYLLAGLSRRGVAGGLERLLACLAARS